MSNDNTTQNYISKKEFEYDVNVESITRYMQRKEHEIAVMTAYINKVGENGAGAQYMELYKQELQLWDNAKAKRDSYK